LKTAAEVLGVITGLCVIACAVLTFSGQRPSQAAEPIAQPVPFAVPYPVPAPSPTPDDKKPHRRPFLPWRAEDNVGAAKPPNAIIGGLTSPDGTETVMLDLPPACRLKNTGGMGKGGPGTGSGLCVFTSLNHAAFWQSMPCLYDLQSKMTHEPGGGYPDKVDAMLARFCSEIKGQYVQNTDCSLNFLRDVIESGRMPGITYDGTLDPHYQYHHIEHMVNCVSLTNAWAVVLDNNSIADNQLVWMKPEALDWMLTAGHTRKGWGVVFKAPGPLPIPRN
jgi:hypothetical protein